MLLRHRMSLNASWECYLLHLHLYLLLFIGLLFWLQCMVTSGVTGLNIWIHMLYMLTTICCPSKPETILTRWIKAHVLDFGCYLTKFGLLIMGTPIFILIHVLSFLPLCNHSLFWAVQSAWDFLALQSTDPSLWPLLVHQRWFAVLPHHKRHTFITIDIFVVFCCVLLFFLSVSVFIHTLAISEPLLYVFSSFLWVCIHCG